MSMADTSDNPYAAPQTPGVQEAGWRPGFARLILALSILWLWQIPFAAAALSSDLANLWNASIPEFPGQCIALILHLGLSWFFAYWITQQNHPQIAVLIFVPSTVTASALLVAGFAVGYNVLRLEWPAFVWPLAGVIALFLTFTQTSAFKRAQRYRAEKQAKQ